MESGVAVAETSLASAECAEVLRCTWDHVFAQFYDNATHVAVANAYVQKHARKSNLNAFGLTSVSIISVVRLLNIN